MAIWHLCVVAFVVTAGEILVDPSVVALVPTVVDDDQLDAANSRISSVEIVTNDVAGRPVGATVFGLAPWLPFVVDGASYLLSVLPFRRLPRQRGGRDLPERGASGPTPVASVAEDAREGLRYLRRHPVLAPVTAATAVYFLGAATGFSLLVLLVVDVLDGPAWSFGVVLVCGAVGAVLGTLLGGRLAERFGLRAALAGATCIEGLAMVALAGSSSVWMAAAIWFVAGVPFGARLPVARSLQQRLTPNRLLGRVNVSARMFTRGVIVIGALGSGGLAVAVGLRSTFVIAGAVEIVAAVLLARALRRTATSPPPTVDM